ncbi:MULTISPECIES: hypothetical protein [Sutcliffiella]|uniref:Uncharacterized protein n=1 Tax=Sutcliffiella cohnii TaxID=33932 RepID=A0A223KN64_9BACI|nr:MULTISPECIES: hypothetical protein [Sutcliffiella]AST90945.1 hypothetical protein BC6307_06450 [Sutcliffiella cohnii]WBL16738.1 hypothetical protein O1A01_08935 [Sutcliffiella sp. NC1]
MVENTELNKLYDRKKIAQYWLLGVVLITYCSLQINRYSILINIDYSLHEVISALANLMWLIPIFSIVYIILTVKYLFKRRLKQRPAIDRLINDLIIFIAVCGMSGMIVYYLGEVSTSGVIKIEEKIVENDQYYVVINEKKIKVTSNEFHLIDESQEYLGSYVWNQFTPDKGKLTRIGY